MRAENIRLRDEIAESARRHAPGGRDGRRESPAAPPPRPPAAASAHHPGQRDHRPRVGWVGAILTINRGRQDDIRRLAAVITGAGDSWGAWSRSGRPRLDRAGADRSRLHRRRARGRTRTAGIVEGAGAGHDAVQVHGARRRWPAGRVTSSSPRGRGPRPARASRSARVRAIDDRGSALFHFAVLTPVVDFSRVEEVLLVVTPGGGGDVTAFFPRGSRVGARPGRSARRVRGRSRPRAPGVPVPRGGCRPRHPARRGADAGPAARSGVRLRGRTGVRAAAGRVDGRAHRRAGLSPRR